MKQALFLILIVGLFSCKKKNNIPISVWRIEGKEYSSQNVTKTQTKGSICYIKNHDKAARFQIYIYSSGFPKGQNIKLLASDTMYQSGAILLSFCLDTTCYSISPNDVKSIYVSSENNRGVYNLPPTWFINHENHNDSVLIEATLREP